MLNRENAKAAGKLPRRLFAALAALVNEFVQQPGHLPDVNGFGDVGVHARVAKPIQMDKLKAAIRQVMEAHNTSAAGQKI